MNQECLDRLVFWIKENDTGLWIDMYEINALLSSYAYEEGLNYIELD